MQKIFKNLNPLDRRCYEQYGLSEDILMEHAANAIASFIKSRFPKHDSVLIVAGSGNNGADGITLARILHGEYQVKLYMPLGIKSDMARIQLERAEKVGVEIVSNLVICDVVVDALFGSGFSGEMDEEVEDVIDSMNVESGYKIACDVPSGITKEGNISDSTFIADTTITMGSLKLSLFLDETKDFVGDIIVADLGVSRALYEEDSDYFLIDEEDFKAPFRTKKNTHKGDFGHLAVVGGEKAGASVMSSLAAFRFGTALVTIISPKTAKIPFEIMQSPTVPLNTTAISIGMGLGGASLTEDITEALYRLPVVVDADMFYKKETLEILKKNHRVVLTPHPKEFSSLMKLCGLGEYTIEEIQKRRFELAAKFCAEYKDAVLILKGANMIIGHNKKLYINSYGMNALAKGGSGDVLSGFVSALLAQKYEPVDAAIHGTLAMTKSLKNVTKNNYALTPFDLIEAVGVL